jgi:glutamate transport system permease protein
MSIITSHLSVFLGGLAVSAQITLATFALAFALGLVLATCRISPIMPLRAAAGLYVAVLRSIPLLAVLILFVFGLPYVGLTYSLLWTAVTGMSLYWAAFFCEAVRSGIRTVPAGQIEAARSLGLTFGQVLRLVVLPQALRAMVQPLANLLIAVTLNSSLAAAVGVTSELTGQTELLDQKYAEPLLIFGAAAACYVALTFLIGRAAAATERRVAMPR